MGASVLLTPAASADESNGLAIELVDGVGIHVDPLNSEWYSPWNRPFDFHINVTDTSEFDDTDLTLFVSVPFEVVGYEGEGWACRDVDGGVECAIPDLVVPGETWPTLTIEGQSGDRIDDSIDVYASSRLGDAHGSVPFNLLPPHHG